MLGIRRPLKPCENGRNIVGQRLPTLLDVTCCVCLHTLLHVVGSCGANFETGQTFSYVQTDAKTPNIVAPTMLGVVACVLAVVCKRMQQLPTMSGPALRRGKDTTHKSL